MAQFQVAVPPDFRALLEQQVRDIHSKQIAKEAPAYPLFVWNLMKSLPTLQEEIHHAATGIAGEGGEILDASKKVWVYGKPLDVGNMVEELGDLLFYFQAMVNVLGISMEQVMAANMVKLMKRYHEGKYSDAQANARADKQPAPSAPPAPAADRKFFAGEGQHGQRTCMWPGVPACATVIGSKKNYCAVHEELIQQNSVNYPPTSDKAGPGMYTDKPSEDLKEVTQEEIDAMRRRALQGDPETVGEPQ